MINFTGDEDAAITAAVVSTGNMKYYKADGIYNFSMSGNLPATGTLTPATPAVTVAFTKNYSETMSFDLEGGIAAVDVFKAPTAVTSAEQAEAATIVNEYIDAIIAAEKPAEATDYAVVKGEDTAATVSYSLEVVLNDGADDEETITVDVTVTGTVADAETNGAFTSVSVEVAPVTTSNGVLDFTDSTVGITFTGCEIDAEGAVSTVPATVTLTITGTAKLDSRTVTIE